jgi:ABC-2 type transport system ATP-binding protein
VQQPKDKEEHGPTGGQANAAERNGGGGGRAERSAIRFDGVTKRYGPVLALDHVSLSIERNEMFGLIGPDGAGKTTAIRIACGLLATDEGTVRVLGRDPAREHGAITGAVGYLSQRFSLYGDLSIDENLAFFAEIHGVRRYQAARDRLLAMTQLTPFRERRADRLSGGMKQKLALACTLVHAPELLLLDEPTTGVDPVSRREFWKLLSEFLASGLTIVMATPYLDEAERCSRVAMLHDGQVLAIDDPDHLRSALGGQLVELITGGARPPVDLLARIPGIDDVQVFGDRAHLRFRGGVSAERMAALTREIEARGVRVVSARPVAASLEDVFIDRIARSA